MMSRWGSAEDLDTDREKRWSDNNIGGDVEDRDGDQPADKHPAGTSEMYTLDHQGSHKHRKKKE